MKHNDNVKLPARSHPKKIEYTAEEKDRLLLQKLAGVTGSELFGSRTIKWTAIGTDWKERAYNYVRSWTNPEYAALVREEFFNNLKERVELHATTLRSTESPLARKATGVNLLRNILDTNSKDISEDKKMELIVLMAETNPELQDITEKDIENSRAEIQAGRKNKFLENPELTNAKHAVLKKAGLNENEIEGIMINPNIININDIENFKEILEIKYPMINNQEHHAYLDEIKKGIQEFNIDTIKTEINSFDDTTIEKNRKNQVRRLAYFQVARDKMTSGDTFIGDEKRTKFFKKYPQYNLITTKGDFEAFEKDWNAFRPETFSSDRTSVYENALNYIQEKAKNKVDKYLSESVPLPQLSKEDQAVGKTMPDYSRILYSSDDLKTQTAVYIKSMVTNIINFSTNTESTAKTLQESVDKLVEDPDLNFTSEQKEELKNCVTVAVNHKKLSTITQALTKNITTLDRFGNLVIKPINTIRNDIQDNEITNPIDSEYIINFIKESLVKIEKKLNDYNKTSSMPIQTKTETINGIKALVRTNARNLLSKDFSMSSDDQDKILNILSST